MTRPLLPLHMEGKERNGLSRPPTQPLFADSGARVRL